MRLHQNKVGGGTHLLAGGASLLTLLILGAMIFPALPQSAQAEEITSKVKLTVNPVISISLQNALNVDALPTQDGTFSSNTAALSISTNNETGYSLYLATGNGENTLTSQNPGISNVISAVNGGDNGVTSANFGNNTWGYSLSQDSVSDATAYKAVPTATGDTAIISTSSPTEADTYNLTFGTKVDTSLPSGTYSNDVVVSVVANPAFVPAFDGIQTMQEMTAEICSQAAVGDTAQLIDTRDNNTYTVAKLPDNNCWMTQNLRLSGGKTLTSADSNVTRDWPFPTDSLTLGNTYTEALSAISDDSNPDMAFEYGGYYNYCAASAGTACSSALTQNATQDICPKEWRLPTSSEISGITSYGSVFLPIYSGAYVSGLFNNGSSPYGTWWSARAINSRYYFVLHYNGDRLYVDDGGAKFHGYSIRCIRSNPGTLTINFNGNGSDGGSTASQQIAAGSTASLNTNGFTRTGYAFTGWNTAADGSGTSYADGADYAVTPATGDATVTLYAQWGPSIQDFTNAQCQSLASNNNYTVYDERDGSDYTVRYINGACWMTQNLRLSGGRTLTSADSNVVGDWTFPSTPLAGSYSYTDPQVTISSNTSYGGYYNFCAASAGTNCQTSSTFNTTYDICPKGWELPSLDQFSGITSYVDAFSPVYSGAYGNGTLSNTGSIGYWWSAIAFNSNIQYNLYYYGGSLNTGLSSSKGNGFSVRCIRSS